MISIFNTEEHIKAVLMNNPTARDNDNLLMCDVYSRLGASPWVETFGQIMLKVEANELPPPESIARIRRQIQKEEPALQGTKYHRRQCREEEVKKEITQRVPDFPPVIFNKEGQGVLL